VLGDEDEWARWQKRSDPVTHIELSQWADCMVIAPLSANTLAKLSHGLCDNLLTCVYRAWNASRKLVLVAPAMNTAMWQHPATRKQLKQLTGTGVRVVDPVVKNLMCGVTGMGAMASPLAIAMATRECLDLL
jgi:phosphopantothenoylcysteine decarboxylase